MAQIPELPCAPATMLSRIAPKRPRHPLAVCGLQRAAGVQPYAALMARVNTDVGVAKAIASRTGLRTGFCMKPPTLPETRDIDSVRGRRMAL